MNINLLSLCARVNHYKRHLYKKCTVLDERSVSNCSCRELSPKSADLTSHNSRRQQAPPFTAVSFTTPRRNCSTNGGGPPVRRLPPLMDFPEIVWPSIIKSLRNFILTTFIIKPYFDREFNLPDFVAGSKKAVEVVSAKISEGELATLDGLVAKDAIPDLQKSVGQMSLSQRQQIGISLDDIYFSFPYQIGIMFDDDASLQNQKRFVEITMVYHTFRGLEGMKSRGEELPLNVGMLPQYRDSISICNYRFIKEFTKGVESDWTVNLLNHFKPSDYIDQ